MVSARVVSGESRRQEVHQQRRARHAGQHHDTQDEREPAQHGARDASGALVIFRAEPAGVDRDEGRRERAFAEQVLQQVGNAKGGRERVRLRTEAEVVRERALTDQSRQAAQHDAARHEHGSGATGSGQGLLRGGREGRLDWSSSSFWKNWFSSLSVSTARVRSSISDSSNSTLRARSVTLPGMTCSGPSRRRAIARPIGESTRMPNIGIMRATSMMIPMSANAIAVGV